MDGVRIWERLPDGSQRQVYVEPAEVERYVTAVLDAAPIELVEAYLEVRKNTPTISDEEFDEIESALGDDTEE